MGEEVQAALEKANPNIKIQTNLFLYRVFMKFNAQSMPKKLLKTLVPIILKVTFVLIILFSAVFYNCLNFCSTRAILIRKLEKRRTQLWVPQ